MYRFLFISLFLALVACKKDDKKTSPPPPPPPPPPAAPVLSALPGGGKDTLSVGDTLQLIAKLTAKDTVKYNWKIGGQSVGTDSVFAYAPTTRGDYQVTIVVSNQSGSDSATYYMHVYAAYENGFFIINEGTHPNRAANSKYFVNSEGSVSFFRYDKQIVEGSVYTKANPGKDLGPATSIPEYGAIWDGKFYVLCEAGGPIVQADALTLKETGRVQASAATDWRAFLGIDSTHALVSSNTGIYMLNLTTMTIGGSVSSITGQVGDMTSAGNYIFVISQADGLVALNKSDYSVAKMIDSSMTHGFAKTPDGGVWAGGAYLVRVDPATLDTTENFVINIVGGSWVPWHPGQMVASTIANTFWFAVFYGQYGDTYSSNTVQPPWSFGNYFMYGDGFGYDPVRGLYILTLQAGQGNDYSYNALWIPENTVTPIVFNGFYFSTMMVFH